MLSFYQLEKLAPKKIKKIPFEECPRCQNKKKYFSTFELSCWMERDFFAASEILKGNIEWKMPNNFSSTYRSFIVHHKLKMTRLSGKQFTDNTS